MEGETSVFINIVLFIFWGALRHFQQCTSHITIGTFMGRGIQHIQLVKDLYCKLSTISKQ